MNSTIIPDWPAPSHIKAYNTTRVGGFSQGKFASLNLSYSCGDDEEHVSKNRVALIERLNIPREPCWIKQVHSAIAVEACSQFIEADATYTSKPRMPCLVLTADCLPLLITNMKGTEVAAIHAGWRGLANGVIEACLSKLSTPASQLLVWLGPAIGKKVFEVGSEVRDQFLNNDHDNESAFIPHSEEKWLADIYQLAHVVLKKSGVTAIYGGTHCTYTEQELFFRIGASRGRQGGWQV